MGGRSHLANWKIFTTLVNHIWTSVQKSRYVRSNWEICSKTTDVINYLCAVQYFLLIDQCRLVESYVQITLFLSCRNLGLEHYLYVTAQLYNTVVLFSWRIFPTRCTVFQSVEISVSEALGGEDGAFYAFSKRTYATLMRAFLGQGAFVQCASRWNRRSKEVDYCSGSISPSNWASPPPEWWLMRTRANRIFIG